MIPIDLETLDGPHRRSTEICVIGAGIAGITLTRRLLAAGRRVLLLESGGRDYRARIADLNDGASIGRDYYPLRDARLRFFGGTTAIWGGRCATLDPIDLEARDWVPGSGWPIGFDELDRYYRQARPLFGLDPDPATLAALVEAGAPMPRFDPDRIATPLWSFDPRFDRFTLAACADLVAHPRCEIVLHATATELAIDAGTGRIDTIVARCPGRDAVLRVDPAMTVLATGGIENARLLLASRSVMASGIGNGHDQVGRAFMEHPHARGGRIVDARAWPLLKAFGRRHRVGDRDVAALIAPSPALQRRERILNTSLTIVARQPEGARQFWGMRAYSGLKHDIAPTRGGRRLWMATRRVAAWTQRSVDPLRPWLLHRAGQVELALLVRAEQAPSPNSRVTLGGQRDELGIPRAVLDWRLGEIDKRSVSVLVDTLGAELSRLSLGRVEPAGWLSDPAEDWRSDPLVSAHPIGGYHHIGTTRMSHDPRHGVTDGDGRVHGCDNLYVVGSSTFPTSSWANPTLTIAALALRTADHLARRLAAPAPAVTLADAAPNTETLAS